MPDDCLRFKEISADYNVNDDAVRNAEFQLVTELADPYSDVFQELGQQKTGIDSKRAMDVNTDSSIGSENLSDGFVEGSHFDFF